MSFPSEGVESAFKNHIDEVKNYLDYKHKSSYAVYNISQKSYRTIKFENRVGIYLCISTGFYSKLEITHKKNHIVRHIVYDFWHLPWLFWQFYYYLSYCYWIFSLQLSSPLMFKNRNSHPGDHISINYSKL